LVADNLTLFSGVAAIPSVDNTISLSILVAPLVSAVTVIRLKIRIIVIVVVSLGCRF